VRLCTVISGQEVGIMLIDSRSSSAAFYPNEAPRILQRHQMKAKTNVSKAKSRRGFTLVEMLVVIGMIAALAGISFPVYKSIQKKVEKQQVQMMWSSLERAVDNFETEYNYLPYVGAAYPSADTLLKEESGEITIFTSILAGVGTNCNFKKIKFFEYKEPKGGPGTYIDGLLITDTQAILYRPCLRAGAPSEYRRMTVDYDGDGEITDYPLSSPDSFQARMYVFDWGADASWTTWDDNYSNRDGFD